MTEDLLFPTTMKLFGRDLAGLKIDRKSLKSGTDGDAVLGSLKGQLARKDGRLARIYGFSFEGHYYPLAKPAILLVFGEGKPVDNSLEVSGVPAKDWKFGSDVLMWAVDKEDITLCLDMASASYETLLLEASVHSRADMSSRADISARADMSSRADMTSRADMSARADMSGRHRFKG